MESCAYSSEKYYLILLIIFVCLHRLENKNITFLKIYTFTVLCKYIGVFWLLHIINIQDNIKYI